VRVLVTGASGVIGHATVELLGRRGHEVVALTSADGDLRDREVANALFAESGAEGVIHFAARVHGLMGNTATPAEMYLDNVLINTHVVDAAQRAGVRKLVGMGSVAAYPAGIPLPMVEDDIWSGRPHGSEAAYGHAKRAMLAQLEAYAHQYGMDYAFAVSTNLFGPHDRFDEEHGHVLPSLISKFHRGTLDGGPVTVWGTGRAVRDFLFAEDAAAAMLALLERGSGTYNLASGHRVTIRELVEILARVSGFSGEIVWDATKPDGQVAREYDTRRIRALGWAPEVPLEDALERTFTWYAAHRADVRR